MRDVHVLLVSEGTLLSPKSITNSLYDIIYYEGPKPDIFLSPLSTLLHQCEWCGVRGTHPEGSCQRCGGYVS